MANYSYTAVTYDNTITSGMLTAKNPKEALEIVLARFAYPVRIHKTVPRALEFLYKDAGMTKMKASDTAGFMILLGEMIMAGMSVSVSLINLARSGDRATASFAKSVHMRMIEGDDLAQAFSYCAKMIGADYGEYIRVGVSSGNTGSVLVDLADSLTSQEEARKKVRNALRYPIAMSIFTLVVGVFLFTSIVPKVADSVLSIIDDAELPQMTKIAIAISNFLINRGLILSILLALIVGLTVFLLKKPLNYQWHAFQTRIPAWGKIVINRDIGIFFRLLGVAVSAGMPMAAAMYAACGGISNRYVRTDMEKAARAVQEDGATITEALIESKFVTGLEIPVMETGVRSSHVQKMAMFISHIKEGENEQKIRLFAGLINPILLAIIGAVVGCVMFAVYGPVFSVMQNMS